VNRIVSLSRKQLANIAADCCLVLFNGRLHLPLFKLFD